MVGQCSGREEKTAETSHKEMGRVILFLFLCCRYIVPGSILGLSVCRFFKSTVWLAGSVIFLHMMLVFVSIPAKCRGLELVCNMILGTLRNSVSVPVQLYRIYFMYTVKWLWFRYLVVCYGIACSVSCWFKYMLVVVVAPTRPHTVSPFCKRKLCDSLVDFICSALFYEMKIYTAFTN